MENYDLSDDDILYIELSFRKKDKVSLSDISIDENITHVEKKVIDTDKKLLVIPVTIDQDTLGILLPVEVKDNLITNIKLNLDDKDINFMDLIEEKSSFLSPNHVDKISSFDSSYKFYLVKKEQRIPFILAIKLIDKESIDKIMYSWNGVLLNRITDIFRDGYIERTSSNKRMIIKNDKIIKVEQDISLKPIPKPKNNRRFVEDRLVGVIDTETYKAIDGTR
jgi:hypothetical protein